MTQALAEFVTCSFAHSFAPEALVARLSTLSKRARRIVTLASGFEPTRPRRRVSTNDLDIAPFLMTRRHMNARYDPRLSNLLSMKTLSVCITLIALARAAASAQSSALAGDT